MKRLKNGYMPNCLEKARKHEHALGNDIIRRMQNVYFTEIKPRESKFKLKSNFEVVIKYREIEMFGRRIRENVSNLIEKIKNKWSKYIE